MSHSPMSRSWSNVCALLNPDFGIAPDVTFLIVPTNPGSLPAEVKAHRLILGFLSPVFRSQFYGLAQDTSEMISVKGTTKKAFETLIDFIYGKNINWEVMSLSELFDVVNLAEMYILPELMEEVKKLIENYAMTDENLIEAAEMAGAFGHFNEASSALMTNCQNVLKVKIKTLQDASEFAAKYASTEFAILALKLLATITTQPTQECFNCRSNPCKDAIVVTEFETLKPGCVLKTSGSLGDWAPRFHNRSCRVVTLFERGELFSARWTDTNDIHMNDGSEYIFNLNSRGHERWFYACKNI